MGDAFSKLPQEKRREFEEMAMKIAEHSFVVDALARLLALVIAETIEKTVAQMKEPTP